MDTEDSEEDESKEQSLTLLLESKLTHRSSEEVGETDASYAESIINVKSFISVILKHINMFCLQAELNS